MTPSSPLSVCRSWALNLALSAFGPRHTQPLGIGWAGPTGIVVACVICGGVSNTHVFGIATTGTVVGGAVAGAVAGAAAPCGCALRCGRLARVFDGGPWSTPLSSRAAPKPRRASAAAAARAQRQRRPDGQGRDLRRGGRVVPTAGVPVDGRQASAGAQRHGGRCERVEVRLAARD